MMVATDNKLYAKIINIRANFTRMYRQEGIKSNGLTDLSWSSIPKELVKKNVVYGKMIKQDDWVPKKNRFGIADPK